MFYDSNDNKNLNCENLTDRFSAEIITGHKAKLTYPIGLLTEPEGELMGIDYYNSNNTFWSSSPDRYLPPPMLRYLGTGGGGTNLGRPENSRGIRPVITLKSDITLSGSGTAAVPYTIS